MNLEQFEILTVKSGVKSLRSLSNQEVFHPGMGPIAEANLLHVKQQEISKRCLNSDPFVIWDVGLGACGNAIAALNELARVDTCNRIELHSFERSLDPVLFTLKNAHLLEYPEPYTDIVQALLRDFTVQVTPNITWNLHLGEFQQQVTRTDLPTPHSIFYDPYSAASNQEMWTLEVFTALNRQLKPKTPCLWTNYSRSTAVRVTLLLAGFYVGSGVSLGDKAESTIASNHLELLKYPLGPEWLDRVKRSQSASPSRAGQPSTYKPIEPQDFEQLKRCPQFLAEYIHSPSQNLPL